MPSLLPQEAGNWNLADSEATLQVLYMVSAAENGYGRRGRQEEAKGGSPAGQRGEIFLVYRVCPAPMLYLSLHCISDSHDWDRSL